MKPRYNGGPNIAVKVPPHQFDETVAFYRDILSLEPMETDGESVSFRFGSSRLWIDRVDSLSKSEIWLEVATSDLPAAAEHLAGAGVARRDEVEPLPDDVDGFWVCDPASNILLVHKV